MPKIVKITPIKERKKVYDITVEDDQSFVANGIVVHNCPICAALDGKFWELGTFDLYCPAHPRCRCILTPVTKSWRELGFDVDELPPGTRASMNGQVPSTMKYSEWFGTQSAIFQRNWLGNKRYELWKNGKLEFEDFLDSKKLLKQPK